MYNPMERNGSIMAVRLCVHGYE